MQEIQYSKLLDITSDWVWAIDTQGYFIYCSKNVENFTGYSVDEILNKSPLDFVPKKSKNLLLRTFIKSVKKKSNIYNLEFQFICKNKSTIVIVANTIPVLQDGGELAAFQGTCKDITKQREAELFLENVNASLSERISNEILKNQKKDKQLINQSRLAQMGEMISMIAHQWRQPLGAISATTINMQMKIELDAYDLSQEGGRKIYQEYLHNELTNINNYVQTLTNTIDDFRNFYKPNKTITTTNLQTLIIKSLNIIKATLKNEDINIIREFNSNERLKIYENEMMQVILSILQNARDNFIEKKIKDPYIIIKADKKTITISDNGGGIPQEIIEKIFDPYFSTKNKRNGTGLGLYMSKIIVEDHHNGILSAQNKDHGASFKIVLF